MAPWLMSAFFLPVNPASTMHDGPCCSVIDNLSYATFDDELCRELSSEKRFQ